MSESAQKDIGNAGIPSAELEALVERIVDSGELGRSRTYEAILRYLVGCSITGETPKEAAIAVDVLGREPDFDVSRDSIVRVHIYHLRNKLESYFDKHGDKEPYRIEIPKGQYTIVAIASGDGGTATPPLQPTVQETLAPRRQPWPAWALALVLGLLLGNLWLLLDQDEVATDPWAAVMSVSPWDAIFDDQVPILLVVGDYYIYGELDERGNVARMVRDFDINSKADLDNLWLSDPDRAEISYNLGLTYLPVGVAPALMEIMPLFHGQTRRLSVKMVSQITAADLTNNHVIYVGYISGMGILQKLMQASSGLRPGVTYDELYDPVEDRFYVSDSGILRGPDSFRDYGMLSVFPSPRGHQIVLIAGMRDAGLVNTAQEVVSMASLQQLQGMVRSQAESGRPAAYEALYEVFGFDHTNFDARLVYSGLLDTARLWSGQL